MKLEDRRLEKMVYLLSARFRNLTVLFMLIQIVWGVSSYSLINSYLRDTTQDFIFRELLSTEHTLPLYLFPLELMAVTEMIMIPFLTEYGRRPRSACHAFLLFGWTVWTRYTALFIDVFNVYKLGLVYKIILYQSLQCVIDVQEDTGVSQVGKLPTLHQFILRTVFLFYGSSETGFTR